jgi:ribosome biogenesis protein MAK21
MKGIVVREIISLILKPRASTAAASSILPSEPAPPTKNTKIVFSDAPSTSASKLPVKSSKEDKKAVGISHARYYAAITFNQIVLSPSQVDRDVARELINIYFELFKDILGQDGADFNDVTEDVPKAKQARDGSSKGKSKKQKGKEIKGDAGFTELEDANSKMISAVLTGVNRALPFAKLDADDPRFKKHLDMLFLITHKSTFNITLQALLLIHQISTTASSTSPSSVASVTDRFYRTLYASLYDSRLSTSSKQAMYLNLLFKCIRSDKNLERTKAFIRRFIQVLASGGGGGAEFTAGGLHLLGEVSWRCITPLRLTEAHFVVPSQLFSTVPGLREMLRAPTGRKSASRPAEDEGEGEERLYDPRKREPEFAHASSSPLWELLPLLSHYHPTVSLHARQLLLSQPLTSTPDLALNTLSHFLDRFVYKNPKKQSSKQKGSSAMQPAAGDAVSGGGVRLIKGEVGDDLGGNSGRGVTVNDEKWWKRRVEDVPIDQVFFHRYFNQKSKLEKVRAAKAKKRKGKGDEEDSEVEPIEDGDEEKEGEVDEDEGGDDGSEKSSEEEAEIWTVSEKVVIPAGTHRS